MENHRYQLDSHVPKPSRWYTILHWSLPFLILHSALCPAPLYNHLSNVPSDIPNHFIPPVINRGSDQVSTIYLGLKLRSPITTRFSLLFYAARLSNLVTPVVWWSANPMSWSELKLSVTYVLVAGDMLAFLRCLLVNSTYGSETYLQSPEWDTQYRSDKVEPQLAPPSANITDRARCRFVVRRVCDVLYIVSIASLVLGIITSGLYIHTTTNESTIRLVTRLRYWNTSPISTVPPNECADMLAPRWVWLLFLLPSGYQSGHATWSESKGQLQIYSSCSQRSLLVFF